MREARSFETRTLGTFIRVKATNNSWFLLVANCLLALSCGSNSTDQQPKTAPTQQTSNAAFVQRSAVETGIHFINRVTETREMNPFGFFNVYNGGGVAAADFNNDGLTDLYFTANQTGNKLYKNLGGLRFEEVTEAAGVAGTSGWTTGVTTADINADGLMDLYVCQSGPKGTPAAELHNLVYINNGDFTFTERGAEYGLADGARSNHATFFDYDADGDLDVYVVNHPLGFGDYIAQRLEKAKSPRDHETDKLFRNEGNNTFTDATDAAGLRNYAFGLSVSTADFNNDGLPDLYVANDYSEPDHHYQNNGDGTFTDVVHSSMMHTSQFSMGSDAADINNDGLVDLLVVDMMAEDNRRKKTNMQGMDRMAFYQNFALGRHLQYMQNVLQLNRGNGRFSEIAELAGISYTDWSWAPLLCDLDNDGYKDVYITNGMRRDIRDNDFVKQLRKLSDADVENRLQELLAAVPVQPIENYVYRNSGALRFEKKNADWNLGYAGFSNGAAYADLDNDGDLDLVVNNLETEAAVFENTLQGGNHLRVKLKGPQHNPFGVGALVSVTTPMGTQTNTLCTSRGFLSASEPVLHFGLNFVEKADLLMVVWPDGTTETHKNVAANKVHEITYKGGLAQYAAPARKAALFAPAPQNAGIGFAHREDFYEDYDREVLLPHRYSQLGPFMATGDVNADGRTDFFVGGGANQAGALYVQQANGTFAELANQPFEADKAHEDMGSALFDADGDGDLDLYVASGSNQWPAGDALYRDRLYLNNGSGQFSAAESSLPQTFASGSCVRPADVDGDGDLDVFVGGRTVPGWYLQPGKSQLLINEGGRFSPAQDVAPALTELGMVTDARWVDVNNDNALDLLVVGEWMAPTLLLNRNGRLELDQSANGLQQSTGWWNCLTAADFDGDGDTDFMVGNLGLNSKYQTTDGPLEVYANDMDGNGSNDIVLAFHQDGNCFPVRGRTCSSEQMPVVAQKLPTYEAFGVASVTDVYGSALQQAIHKKARTLASAYIQNEGDGTFTVVELPVEAQLSTVNAVVAADVNGDGQLDAILAGNNWSAEVETARHDASMGCVLLGDGTGAFTAMPATQAGYFATEDAKHAQLIELGNGSTVLLVANNGRKLEVSRLTR